MKASRHLHEPARVHHENVSIKVRSKHVLRAGKYACLISGF